MEIQELQKLIATLGIDEPGARREIAEGLRTLSPSENAVFLLRGLLASDNPVKRDAAATALRKSGKNGVIGLLKAAREEVSPLARAIAVRWLGESGQEGCFVMFTSFGELGVDPLPTLWDALSDTHGDVRCAALRGIGRLLPRDERTRQEASKCLKDSDPRVRAKAASLLRGFHTVGPAIERALSELLRDPFPEPRIEAALALAGTGVEDDQVCSLLLEALADKHPFIRLSAASRLRHYKTRAREIIPALVKPLGDPEEHVRQRALETLGTFGPLADCAIPAIKGLIAKREMVWECAKALCGMGPVGVEAAAELLAAPEEDVRYEVLKGLGYLGERAAGALAGIRKCLDDPVARVRFRAAQCVLRIDPSRASEVTSRVRAGSEFDRSHLVWYVAEAGEAGAAVLNELSKDKDPALQELAAKGLARMASLKR